MALGVFKWTNKIKKNYLSTLPESRQIRPCSHGDQRQILGAWESHGASRLQAGCSSREVPQHSNASQAMPFLRCQSWRKRCEGSGHAFKHSVWEWKQRVPGQGESKLYLVLVSTSPTFHTIYNTVCQVNLKEEQGTVYLQIIPTSKGLQDFSRLNVRQEADSAFCFRQST